jgi:flagellar biosynthesis/type III secretory pathway protein FliH
MSSRAKRITNPGAVLAFPWNKTGGAPRVEAGAEAPEGAAFQAQLAAVDRDAYARGFSEGETAGAASAAQQGEGMLRPLAEALQGTVTARADMIRRTERQMVELAVTLAQRIVQREIATDQTVLLSMARSAIDKLGTETRITVRLNPEDYEAIGGDRMPQLGTSVTVVADAKVERTGCRIDSELGTLDAGVDAQIQELGRGLLGDDAQPSVLSNVA